MKNFQFFFGFRNWVFKRFMYLLNCAKAELKGARNINQYILESINRIFEKS